MQTATSPLNTLPDITKDSAKENAKARSVPINRVGMSNIAIPVHVTGFNGELLASKAKVDVTVSLDDPNAKGIHMSRLYALLQQYLSNRDLHRSALETLMSELVDSQEGLSKRAEVTLGFDLTVLRPALHSDAYGYQSYKATLCVERHNALNAMKITISIPYSSTCPCSASLSRSALSQTFAQEFEGKKLSVHAVSTWLASKQASIATAHAQRSFARITLSLRDNSIPNFIEIINLAEHALGTPLQTAVKREDEQAFARLNAENLMFVEDAVRRLYHAFSAYYKATHFHVKVEHQESLHAHDAIAELHGTVGIDC